MERLLQASRLLIVTEGRGKWTFLVVLKHAFELTLRAKPRESSSSSGLCHENTRDRLCCSKILPRCINTQFIKYIIYTLDLYISINQAALTLWMIAFLSEYLLWKNNDSYEVTYHCYYLLTQMQNKLLLQLTEGHLHCTILHLI